MVVRKEKCRQIVITGKNKSVSICRHDLNFPSLQASERHVSYCIDAYVIFVISIWNQTHLVTTKLARIDLFLKAFSFLFFFTVAAMRQAVNHCHMGDVCGLDLVQASCLLHPCSPSYSFGQSAVQQLCCKSKWPSKKHICMKLSSTEPTNGEQIKKWKHQRWGEEKNTVFFWGGIDVFGNVSKPYATLNLSGHLQLFTTYW